MKKTFLMLGVATSLLNVSCSRISNTGDTPDNLSNEVVLKWDEIAYEAFGGASYQHSLMASRINAMVHLAMHDAINAIQPKFEKYSFNGKDPGANPIAAAANAAHAVLLNEIPSKKNFLDSALQQTLSTIVDSEAKSRGIKLGKETAQAIILMRKDDGSAGNPLAAVPPSTTAGVFQAVPPFDFYFAPYWQYVQLFGLRRKDQFRCVPPPSLTSPAYTGAFMEVKKTGHVNSSSRTADQTAYSKFWYEFSEAGWNRVARIVSVNNKFNLYETARLFALVDIAMADAYIAGWDSKLHYNSWRPYTAILNANSDGNDHTTPDLSWKPLLITPPIQDYPSTHSALGNAAATVLGRLFGDKTVFSMSSPTADPAGRTRTFTSFSQAAKENADSRVMGGIHFRFACDAGLELGSKIGDWIVDNYLKPLN